MAQKKTGDEKPSRMETPLTREKPVEKTTRQPKLYFDHHNDGPDKKAIQENFLELAKKEESDVKEPSHFHDSATGKLIIQRPKGSVDNIGTINDMSKIKEAVSQRLKNKKTDSDGKHIPPPPGRIHTGIPGLDEVMEGGYKNSSVILVGGGAGSGKSIFSMQFLVEGIIHHDEPGVYISFEQTKEELFDDVSRFGWNLDKKIKDRKLVVLHYTPEQVEKVLESGGGTVRDAIESIKAKRLVIDSLTAFSLLHETATLQRRATLQLFEAVKRWGGTTLVISEKEVNPAVHSSDVLEFEADGVILLYNLRKRETRERSLEIFKMRGIKHSARLFPLKIDNKGIEIFPEDTVF